MNDALLQLESIRVAYPLPRGALAAVDGLSLSLRAGGIGALLGASGCGKTTALRAIAGFEPVRAGRIVLAGTTLSTEASTVPAERRGIGMMFQDYALFPHLDAAANVGFGLAHAPRDERRARVAEMLALVGLPDAARKYPHELSGGQQQRIALARALAPAPRLLLLDEPLSNLDADTRGHLAGDLRRILKAAGTTALLVTHDQAEAFAMADAIGVMERGRLLQWADGATLYRAPADRIVAGFIGRGSVLPASLLGLGGEGDVLVRPEALSLSTDGPMRAEVDSVAFVGPGRVARLRIGDGAWVHVDLPDGLAAAPGDTLAMRIDTAALVRFPPRDAPA